MNHLRITTIVAFALTVALGIIAYPYKIQQVLNEPNKAAAVAAQYYVDSQNGNDTNSGKITSPWKTLNKVNTTQFSPGDTIYLKRGSVWNEALNISSSGNASANITIDAYGQGNLPHITATQLSSASDWSSTNNGLVRTRNALSHALVNGKTGIERRDLKEVNVEGEYYKNNYNGINDEDGFFYLRLTKPVTEYKSPGIEISNINEPVRVLNKQYITIKNIKVTGSNTSNILIDNSDIAQKDAYVTIENVVSTGARYAGVYIKHASKNNVINSEIANNSQEGIRILTESANLPNLGGNIISGNTIYGNTMPGVLVQGYSGSSRGKGNTVKNNIIYENGDGVYVRYSSENIVANNTIYANNNTEWYGEGDGIPIQSSINNQVYENKVYNQRNAGIQLWGGIPTTANPKYGRSDGNKIYKNTIYSNKVGFLVSSNYSSKNAFYYNLIYSNKEWAAIIGHPDNQSNLFHNNTITKNRGALKFYGGAQDDWDIRNNIFSKNPTGQITIPEIDALPTLASNNNFDQDRVSGTNGNPLLADKNAVIADPQFVNTTTNEYSLRNTSPVINKGASLGYISDITNKNIAGNPDIGAFESGTTQIPIVTSAPSATVQPAPVATPSPPLITPSPVSSGLLGYWSLNDNGGPLARESSGNNFWGRLTNGALWTSSGYKTGSPAIKFDKTKKQYIAVDQTNAPNFQTPDTNFTVMAWINPQINSASPSRFREGIISAFSNGGFRLSLNESGNALQFAYRNESGTYYALTSTTEIKINTWQHVAATLNGKTKEVILYINGQQAAKGVGIDSAAKIQNSMQIGANLDNASYFNGTLDEIKLFSKTLSSEEIKVEYQK